MADNPRFAILRTAKLKHMASVHRSLKHSFRTQDTPNADPDRADENTHIGAESVDQARAAVEARLPEKRRKDAVLCIEYLVTASPEAMQAKTREEQDAYLADSLEWLKERHGADNVVYAGIHRDETTPHLYAYVVPLDPDTGRLNAKKWLGGTKALNQMQSDFAARVGERHGLERGIERSRAKHQTVKEFYGALEKAPVGSIHIPPEKLEPKVLRKGWLSKEIETPEMVAARLTEAVNGIFRPIAQKASVSSQERRRAEELRRTNRNLQKRLEAAQRPFQGLSREQQRELVARADEMRRQNELQRRDRTRGRGR